MYISDLVCLSVHSYLKENVKGDTNLLDIQDEMEEVISNAIEQRHRFMVRSSLPLTSSSILLLLLLLLCTVLL